MRDTFLLCILHNASACEAIGMVNTMTANDYAIVAGALFVGLLCIVTLIVKR